MSPIVQPQLAHFAKVLIMAPAGHGKTHLLGTANEDPRTAPMLLLDFEGGSETLGGTGIDVFPIHRWSDYDEAYELLTSRDHSRMEGSSLSRGEQYQSVGLDSTSETHVWALLQILKKHERRRNEKDLIEQGDYGIASTQMRRLMREFRDLPMHVFFTSTVKEIKERGVGTVKVPALAGQMSEEAAALVSTVGYLARDDENTRVLLLQNYRGYRIKARLPKKLIDEGLVPPDDIENPTITSLLDELYIGERQGPERGEQRDRPEFSEVDDPEDEQTETAVDDLGMAELRDELDRREIDWPTGARRAKLKELLTQAIEAEGE